VKIATEMSDVIVDFFTKGVIRNAVNVPTLDWDTYKQLEPYIILAEKIGAFQSQVIQGGIVEAELQYAGTLSSVNTTPLLVAFLKGLLAPMLDIKVNFVNAPVLARERGIKVKETKIQQTEDYAALVTAKIRTDKEELVISGTIFGANNARIVWFGGRNVDIVPQGCVLLIKHTDKPGMIGNIGTLLGKSNINIAEMQVGRKSQGGEAVTIVNVDSCVPAEILEQIKALPNVSRVSHVSL
jgi:D-3-phosphoglycerate dehydrogenase